MTSRHRFRRALCAACVLAAGSRNAAGAQDAAANGQAVRLGGTAVVAQVSSGTLGLATGFVAGGLAARWLAQRTGSDEDRASRVAYAGAAAGAALVTAVGPALIGSRGTTQGSYPAAIGGAIAGGLVSVLLKRIGDHGVFGERGPAAIVAGLVIAAMPGTGATLAYNATR